MCAANGWRILTVLVAVALSCLKMICLSEFCICKRFYSFCCWINRYCFIMLCFFVIQNWLWL